MEDEREKEDETLFKKYFEEKEIEFMFPPETASEMQHQRNINIAKVSACIYHGIHGTDSPSVETQSVSYLGIIHNRLEHL